MHADLSETSGLRGFLPRGSTLPALEWRRRHRWILALLWCHAGLLPVLGLLMGFSPAHGLGHAAPVAAFAIAASMPNWSRRTSSCLASAGLFVCSAVLVHQSGGITEAHFHFFVVVVVLALYEDWVPFLLALGFVVVHHSVFGVLLPHEVFAESAGRQRPLEWALLHGAFIAAAGVACVVGWRVNEDARTAALRSQERFRQSFENAPIGMTVTAADGQWLAVNRALCDLLGRPAAELIEHGLDQVTHPDDREATAAVVERISTGAEQRVTFEKRYVHAAGHDIWAQVNVSALVDDGTMIAQIIDITEHKRNARQAERRILAQHADLAALGKLALERGDIDMLCDEAVARVVSSLGVSHARICCRPGEPAEGWEIRAQAGWTDWDGVDTVATDGLAAEIEYRKARPLLIDDASACPSMAPAAERAGLSCGIAAAIPGVHGRLHGILVAFSQEPRGFTPEDTFFVESVAGIVSSAVRQQGFEESLRHQSLHDALTGLPNRVLLADRLTQAMAQSARTGRPLGVMFVDLDNFKLINDSAGHHAGDALLQQVAARLDECLRPNDTLARFGGDEFVVLCDSLDSDHEALVIAQRLKGAFDAPFPLGGHDQFVRVSIGVAISNPDYQGRPEYLIRDADAAMYRAKEAGRDRIELFDEAMRIRLLRRVEIEKGLRCAIEGGQLRLIYQPLVHLDGRRVTECEALVRWDHPDYGLLSPDVFIPVAEESGLILPLGSWVIDEACRQMAEWRCSGSPALAAMHVAINLSALQIAQHGLADEILRTTRRHGVPADHLVCEITETALIEDPDAAHRTLSALHESGIRVALDDFGTGYSSLVSLKHYPLSIIKLDRSFISGMAAGTRDESIISSLVHMAHSLGLQTVAEGIETEYQRDRLHDMGCDVGQGYLFSRPIEAGELEAFVGLPAVA